VPKKSSRKKKGSRKSTAKTLILELVFTPLPQPKPPFFRGSWTATELEPLKAKKAGTRKRPKKK
jgi:hypothetical protein